MCMYVYNVCMYIIPWIQNNHLYTPIHTYLYICSCQLLPDPARLEPWNPDRGGKDMNKGQSHTYMSTVACLSRKSLWHPVSGSKHQRRKLQLPVFTHTDQPLIPEESFATLFSLAQIGCYQRDSLSTVP